MGTILYINLDLERWIKAMEHFLGNLNASEDTLFFDQQLRFAYSIRRNTTQRGVITIADILSKSEVYQLVIQFLYTQHKTIITNYSK